MAAALTAGLGLPLPGEAAQPPQAGVAGAVVGDVAVAREPAPEPSAVASGMDIFMRDRISTEAESRLQVLLLDETVFTVGPRSDVTIDRFVYDPETGTGEVSASFTKGFMRYVSGKVGKNSPENVTVETPASTIGVRGTAFYVSDVPGEPETYIAGLLGPGPDNNARARRGGFTVKNAEGAVSVTRPGFGVYVTKGEAPRPPVRLSQDLLERLHTTLRPRQRRRQEDSAEAAAPAQPAKADPVAVSGEAVAKTRVDSLKSRDLRGNITEPSADARALAVPRRPARPAR
jgi:hypothetical protein